MIVKSRFSSFIRPLALAVALATAPGVYGAGTAEADAAQTPWAFNLSTYLWLPSVDGNFSAGPFNKSSDISFIDIAGKLRSFPAAFHGHLEAHYERLGFYLDGDYLGLDFNPPLRWRHC